MAIEFIGFMIFLLLDAESRRAFAARVPQRPTAAAPFARAFVAARSCLEADRRPRPDKNRDGSGGHPKVAAAARETEGRRSTAGDQRRSSVTISIRLSPGRRREAEACTLALEALAAYRALDGAVCSELPFLVSAAEACRAGGNQREADAALDLALAQITLRASKIEARSDRNSFLAQQACHSALELRARWCGTSNA